MKADNLLSKVMTVTPVSYTHLDVYKRQNHDIALLSLLSTFQLNPIVETAAAGRALVVAVFWQTR